MSEPAPSTAPMPTRKVNLLLVASSLWIGGAESVIRHLAERLDRRRFNVSVCYLQDRGQIGEALERAGIDIVGVPRSSGVDYLSFRKLLRVIREKRIDVVHTHTTHGLVDAALCKLLRPRLKVLHTFHFGNYPHVPATILWMERACSRLTDRLFAVGEVQRGQVRACYGFADRAISTIRNGVRLPQPSADGSFRGRVGAEDRPLIGTIATLIEQKGLTDLIKVARLVRDRGLNAKFVIIGEGQLRAQLEALRSELGVEDDVVLTGWVTNAADVALPAFDVFFQPSLWEAMSMVTLEAMAAGKAVVATRVGEAAHVIDDGRHGILVDPGDVDAMADAITRLVRDVGLRERMGEAARQQIARQFTVDHMTQAYERAYLDAVR